jgi:hypothetical protein
MSRRSGILGVALLSVALLASTASAGPGGNSCGDPDIPNGVKGRAYLAPTNGPSKESASLETDAIRVDRSSRWSPVIRLILTWARVAAR